MNQNNLVVNIENYQIIKKASLEFEPGLNVIVGESNNGKSAIFRAIDALIYNTPSSTAVTFGEKVAHVNMLYRGSSIDWFRDNRKNSPVSYLVDGVEYGKVGRGQPEFLKDILAMDEIDIEGIRIRINFQDQMSYPFLLDKTPGQLFKFIMSSGEEDNVLQAVAAMKKDQEITNKEIVRLETVNLELQKQRIGEDAHLVVLNKYTDLIDQAFAIDGEVAKLREYVDLITRHRDINASSVKVESELSEVTLRLGILEPIVGIDIDLITQCRSMLVFYNNHFEAHRGLLSRNVTIDGLVDKSPLEALRLLLNEVESGSATVSEGKAGVNRYVSLSKGVSELVKVNGVADSKLSIIARAKFLEDEYKSISSMKSANDELRATINNYKSFMNSSNEVQDRIDNIAVDLDGLEREKASFDVCPFCNSHLGSN